MNKEEIKEYIKAKREPISHCVDLTKYFIGRHKISLVCLTPVFEQEFNSSMYELEKLREENKQLKEELGELKHIHYLIQGGRGYGKTYLLYLQQKNKQLEQNWNKLKEWAKHERKVAVGMQNGYRTSLCDCMMNKMQELEKSDSSE